MSSRRRLSGTSESTPRVSPASRCAQFLPISEWVGGPQAKVQPAIEKVVPLRANDKLPPPLHRSVPGIIRRISTADAGCGLFHNDHASTPNAGIDTSKPS